MCKMLFLSGRIETEGMLAVKPARQLDVNSGISHVHFAHLQLQMLSVSFEVSMDCTSRQWKVAKARGNGYRKPQKGKKKSSYVL